MGALTWHPTTGPAGDLDLAFALSDLARHAQRVYEDAVEDVLPALVRAGGSPGGARPKVLIGLRAGGEPGVCSGEGELPPGWEAWIVKFPAAREDRDVGRRELAWLAMAEAAGIDVPARRLVHLGEVGNKRIAAVAMATFLEMNGYPLRVDELELYGVMMDLAEKRLDKGGLAAWLRRRTRRDGDHG